MEVEQRVKRVIAEHLAVAEANVQDTSRLVEDLGADSLDRVELCMALEEEFEFEVPDEQAEKLETVQQVLDYIKEHVKA